MLLVTVYMPVGKENSKADDSDILKVLFLKHIAHLIYMFSWNALYMQPAIQPALTQSEYTNKTTTHLQHLYF